MTNFRTRPIAEAAPAEFRELMAGFPTGVAIVATITPDGSPIGMTCSSVCSVTVAPPTLLVCIRENSPTLAAMQRRGTFTVNLLHHEAQITAELFASGDPDRFDAVSWFAEPGHGNPHLYDDAHAIADCLVSRIEFSGDHTLVFGVVRQVSHRPGQRPLLHGMRQYSAWPAD
jgi:flavin reductase (NADH)